MPTSGRVASWFADRATATGLDELAQGDVVEVEGAGPALVTALLADRVELAPLSRRAPHVGAPVRRLGPLVTPTGDDLIGRTVDALGRPGDGGAPIARATTAPVFARPPTAFRPAGRRLTFGLLGVDLQRTGGVGGRFVAVGPQRVVLHHFVRHWHHDGKVCVVATVGATSPYAMAARLAKPSSVHVHAGADPSLAEQWLVPWTAMAIANAMRARGRDVVVVIDSLDAWRLPVRHCGWRGAWPTQLLQLSSWAWCAPGGSVTMVACSQDRDLAARAELDRVIDLERAYLGEPDRRATKLIHPPIRFRGKARLAGAWLGGDPAVRACLRYRPTTSIDGLEQLASVLAVIRLRIAEPYVAGFVDAFVEALRRGHAPLLAEIRAAKQLAADELDALLVTAQAVADQTCRRAP